MVATSPSGGLDGQLFVGTTKNIIIEGSLQQKFSSIVQVSLEFIRLKLFESYVVIGEGLKIWLVGTVFEENSLKRGKNGDNIMTFRDIRLKFFGQYAKKKQHSDKFT